MSQALRDSLAGVLAAVRGAPGRDEALRPHGELIDSAFQDWLRAVRAGQEAESEAYLALFDELLPGSPNVLGLGMAMACQTEDRGRAALFAARLLPLDPRNPAVHSILADECRDTGRVDDEVEHRLFLASPEGEQGDRERSRHLYEAVNVIVCSPLTPLREARLAEALECHRQLDVEAGAADPWIRFHQTMMRAVDPASLDWPADAGAPPLPRFLGADGVARDWAGDDVRVLFCVAADPVYCRRYAGLYARSVLRNAGLSCRVVVHVIGAGNGLPEIVRSLGIEDPRVVFSGDDFDPAAVWGRVVDAPTREPIEIPIAHYQSARFSVAASLLAAFGLPVFVSDIDTVLQRGVGDLIVRTADADVVLNENRGVTQIGAAITANLLLLRPTPGGRLFADFLPRYLAAALAEQRIPKWVDQIALAMARHYLVRRMPEARIGYFDTGSDINNVVYQAYEPNPYCFLSLYQGFDLASLVSDLNENGLSR
jgi:hypothetical protein